MFRLAFTIGDRSSYNDVLLVYDNPVKLSCFLDMFITHCIVAVRPGPVRPIRCDTLGYSCFASHSARSVAHINHRTVDRNSSTLVYLLTDYRHVQRRLRHAVVSLVLILV